MHSIRNNYHHRKTFCLNLGGIIMNSSSTGLISHQEVIEKRELFKKKRLRNQRRSLVIMAVLSIAVISLLTTRVFASANDMKIKTKDNVVLVEKEKVSTQAVREATVNVYNSAIPMPKAHQKYLHALTTKYDLDYKKTLALIQHESQFDANALNATKDYGYFQINLVNHKDLAKKLGTANQPFNPYVNMQWGVYMLSELYSDWAEEGYTGQALDEVVWSSYNKGKTGFLKYGHATVYINKMKVSMSEINKKF